MKRRLLGMAAFVVVALRTGQGRKILYDGEQMCVTNIAEANQYLTRDYRAGWAV